MHGRSILVIRPSSRFSDVLRSHSFDVTDLELVKAEALTDLTEADAAASRLGEYDGLFFTSPKAAEVFCELARTRLTGYCGKLYVLGWRASAVLEAFGLRPVYSETANTAAEMMEDFGDGEFAGKRYLYVRGEKSLRTVPRLLAGVARVDEVVVYRTVDAVPKADDLNDVRSRINAGAFDWICFFSPSGVGRFQKLFSLPPDKNIRIAAIGETTAAKANEAGLLPDLVSPIANAEQFANFLAARIKDIE